MLPALLDQNRLLEPPEDRATKLLLSAAARCHGRRCLLLLTLEHCLGVGALAAGMLKTWSGYLRLLGPSVLRQRSPCFRTLFSIGLNFRCECSGPGLRHHREAGHDTTLVAAHLPATQGESGTWRTCLRTASAGRPSITRKVNCLEVYAPNATARNVAANSVQTRRRWQEGVQRQQIQLQIAWLYRR
jgi:hypothetical protein